MRGWKSLIPTFIILTLFGTGALLLQGQKESEVNAQEGGSMKESIQDFPSPIAAKPLRLPGETYSEELDMMLFHPGTDFAQAEGAVVRVKQAGKVTYAGPDPFLGHKVEVDCGDAWSVVYGGLKNLRVKEGDWIEVDQAIGQIGYYPDIYGDVEQPHLHYEIWHEDLVQVPI